MTFTVYVTSIFCSGDVIKSSESLSNSCRLSMNANEQLDTGWV